MEQAWYLEGESGDGKVIYISGPYDAMLELDHDDVDTYYIDRIAPLIVEALNKSLPFDMCQKAREDAQVEWDRRNKGWDEQH